MNQNLGYRRSSIRIGIVAIVECTGSSHSYDALESRVEDLEYPQRQTHMGYKYQQEVVQSPNLLNNNQKIESLEMTMVLCKRERVPSSPKINKTLPMYWRKQNTGDLQVVLVCDMGSRRWQDSKVTQISSLVDTLHN
jgi:hypothetical protein